MEPRIDVTGLGNALVDTLLLVDDADLKDLGFARGIMHIVQHEQWQQAYERFKAPGMQVESGGSAANTIAALGMLGARAVFRGQVGADALGRRYAESLRAACGDHSLRVAPSLNTGKCLSLVSRTDQERTMLTDLGAALMMKQVSFRAGLETLVIAVFVVIGVKTAPYICNLFIR